MLAFIETAAASCGSMICRKSMQACVALQTCPKGVAGSRETWLLVVGNGHRAGAAADSAGLNIVAVQMQLPALCIRFTCILSPA